MAVVSDVQRLFNANQLSQIGGLIVTGIYRRCREPNKGMKLPVVIAQIQLYTIILVRHPGSTTQ